MLFMPYFLHTDRSNIGMTFKGCSVTGVFTSTKEVAWKYCDTVCLSVRRLSQKVIDGFEPTFVQW